MYKTILTEKALKDLNNIDNDNKQRILLKIKEYSLNPFNYLIKLSNPLIGTYRFRIGDYRVFFDIIDNIIVILRIGHRKDIYT